MRVFLFDGLTTTASLKTNDLYCIYVIVIVIYSHGTSSEKGIIVGVLHGHPAAVWQWLS